MAASELTNDGSVDLQCLQTILGRAYEPRVVSVQRKDQLFLGVDELRRIQGIQRLSFFHSVAIGFDVEFFYPTLHPGVHMGQLILVILHVAHGNDGGLQRAQLCGGCAYAEIVDDVR